MCAGDEARKRGDPPKIDVTKSPKTGVSVTPQNGLMSSKSLIKKKVLFTFSLDFLLDEKEAKKLHSREKRSHPKSMKELFREVGESLRLITLVIYPYVFTQHILN